MFRGLATVGAIHPFVDHQRRAHTFVTNDRGTADARGGRRVVAVLLVAVNRGHVAMSFDLAAYSVTSE